MSLCTCHIFCSLVLCSHLHNSCVGNNGKRCRGCTLGCIGCARRVLRQGAHTQLPLRWHWELIRAELQALGRAAHSSSLFNAELHALGRAAHSYALFSAELQALGRAVHSSALFSAELQVLGRAAHPSSYFTLSCKGWGGRPTLSFLFSAEPQALGRAAHSSSPFCVGMQALVRAAHPSSLCKRWGGLHSSTTGALWRGGGRALLCRCGRWWRARETCSQGGRDVSSSTVQSSR